MLIAKITKDSRHLIDTHITADNHLYGALNTCFGDLIAILKIQRNTTLFFSFSLLVLCYSTTSLCTVHRADSTRWKLVNILRCVPLLNTNFHSTNVIRSELFDVKLDARKINWKRLSLIICITLEITVPRENGKRFRLFFSKKCVKTDLNATWW